MLNVLDLFSGIGGFTLGLERTGRFRTVAFCESDPACQNVLRKHWPDVTILSDVRTLTRECLHERIDVITGGFPCQPFSSASRGRRVAPDLWPFMRDAVEHIRPRIVIAENVQEKPIERARAELAELGYRGCSFHIPASSLGADHQRSRWWLCAYTDDQGELHLPVDAEVARMQAVCRSLWGPDNYARAIRVPHGLSGRVDRLKQLGNAVVPQIPQLLGEALAGAL